jgi:hypothetical protein
MTVDHQSVVQSFERRGYNILGVDAADSRLLPPEPGKAELEQPLSGAGAFIGPINNITGFLVVPPGLSQPGYNLIYIHLPPGSVTPPFWVVSASVTEIIPPFTPHMGAALITTNGVQFDQPTEMMYVHYDLEWQWPLPLGAMLLIGHGLGVV